MKKQLRFSVRDLLVFSALLCATLYCWYVTRRLQDAEAELRQLRTETGRLTVEDNSLVHAIEIDTADPNSWRWRLFLPKGHRYSLNIASRDIPFEGVPNKPNSRSVSGEPYWERDNEVIVNARLAKTELGEWILSVDSRIGDSKNQLGSVTATVDAKDMAALAKSSSFQVNILGNDETDVCEPTEPIVLYRKRPMLKSPGGSTDFDKEPSSGLMIWLQPQ